MNNMNEDNHNEDCSKVNIEMRKAMTKARSISQSTLPLFLYHKYLVHQE